MEDKETPATGYQGDTISRLKKSIIDSSDFALAETGKARPNI